MLGMLLDPILSGAVEDAYIVPVSVYYDRVMETRTYVTELLGAQKRKDSSGPPRSLARLFGGACLVSEPGRLFSGHSGCTTNTEFPVNR